MTSSDKTILNKRLNLGRKIKKAKSVRNCRTRLTQDLRKLLLGKIPLINQLTITSSLFDGSQIRTLQVLNQSKLKDFFIRDIFDNYWNLSESSQLRSLVTSFSRHDLIGGANLTNKQGLKNTILLN